MSHALYDSWGFSRSRASVSLLVAGVWNNFVKLGLPVFALALLAPQGGVGGGRVPAGLLGLGGLAAAVVLVTLMLRSEDNARAASVFAPVVSRQGCADSLVAGR